MKRFRKRIRIAVALFGVAIWQTVFERRRPGATGNDYTTAISSSWTDFSGRPVANCNLRNTLIQLQHVRNLSAGFTKATYKVVSTTDYSPYLPRIGPL